VGPGYSEVTRGHTVLTRTNCQVTNKDRVTQEAPHPAKSTDGKFTVAWRVHYPTGHVEIEPVITQGQVTRVKVQRKLNVALSEQAVPIKVK
jgi:uncharacterized protein with FMN-binding domain